MSWDVVVFNSTQKIKSIKDVDETKLIKIDFAEILKKSFDDFLENDGLIEIKGIDFSLDFLSSKDLSSNILLHLIGQNAIFELIELSKVKGWQIYDSSLNEMIDINNPSINGYENHKGYVSQILNKK